MGEVAAREAPARLSPKILQGIAEPADFAARLAPGDYAAVRGFYRDPAHFGEVRQAVEARGLRLVAVDRLGASRPVSDMLRRADRRGIGYVYRVEDAA